MRRGSWSAAAVSFIVAVSVAAVGPAADALPGTVWVDGTLLLAWSSAPPVGDGAAVVTAVVRRDDGSRLVLGGALDSWLAGLGGPQAAAGRRVSVLVAEVEADGPLATPLAIRATGGLPDAPEVVSGSHPYVSLMCAFQDIALPPEDLSYFQGMYANTWPGLDHYWRHQSYDMVDVVGSTAAGWFTLPHTRDYYTGLISGGNYSIMLNALYDDCTGAAAGTVNLNDFDGVNMMFNETFGPYAWGGWGGVTWEPPWGWHNVAVIGHEMGHAFGLPHSNNADNDGYPYDNPWDVMSDSWGYAMSDATYGTVGKHTIAYHKDSLGWIAAGRKAAVTTPGAHSFDVDHLTLADTPNLHLVTVPIPGSSRFYTVEVRDRVSYDGNLPGFAVVLHEVDPFREEPAWLVDADDPSNGADAGAMWLPGECYDDPDAEILICVVTTTTEGFTVEVFTGDGYFILRDGFESGTTSAWSVTVP